MNFFGDRTTGQSPLERPRNMKKQPNLCKSRRIEDTRIVHWQGTRGPELDLWFFGRPG